MTTTHRFWAAVPLALVALSGCVYGEDTNLLRCGDPVSLRSASTWRYLNVPKSGEALVSAGNAGVAEALHVDCKDKAPKDLLETGDTVSFRVFRGDKYLRDMGKDGFSLISHSDRTWFYLEDPQNLQSRIHINSGTMKLSIRTLGKDNGFMSVGDGDKLVPSEIRAKASRSQFTMTRVASDFTARCPVDSKGKMCSGQGVCQSNYCVCNREWTGEYCEHKREVAVCKAVGDPHWHSFDGAKYNMYETGEFLFYAEPDSPNYEAVTVFLSPWNKASVITGVTVRRDNDYITLWGYGRNQVTINCDSDKKTGKTIDYSREISNLGARGLTLESGLNVKIDKGWWVVSSPSFVSVRFRGFSLYVTTEEPRTGSARGLCGNNNKRGADDMVPRRRWNEPTLDVVDEIRIEDGKTYDYQASRLGKNNGRPSSAFYQCKGDNTFFNFMTMGSGTSISPAGAGSTSRNDDDSAPIRPDIVFTEDKASAAARAAADAEATVFGPEPLLEEAFGSEKCKNDKKMIMGARKCCTNVLIKAKVLTNDGSVLPSTTDALRGLASQGNLDKAWAPKLAPRSDEIEFDAVTCVQDYCMGGNCQFGESHAEDVEGDEIAHEFAENEKKEMVETNKRQVAAEE